MTQVGVKQSIPDRIINVLKTAFEDQFKAYFYGDPVAIPQSLMPCVIVDEVATNYDFGPTGMDEVEHEIQIQVVYNKKDDFGKQDTEVALARTLSDVVQGRDNTTGEFLADSLMGVLRKNITLANTSINQTGRVEFGIVPRPEDVLSVEAQITLTITELQPIATRT